ncbi:MAG: 4'-phosphopantetheinyl transferase superfamily protein [Planctomycetes bacterium]|nr:4'-phosphopantetheinyl transferase superfamily protein [Planctomycetota bacterium]
MDDVPVYPSFQPESAGGPALEGAAIHVWAVPLAGEPGRCAALLSAVEREKAERFRFLDHRRRYAIGHGALRAILGGYAGMDPAGLTFAVGPRGKPSLVEPKGLHFNLSHSAQLALIAVARHEVGVDCEKMRHLESRTEIARRHFSPVEFAALEALPESEQLRGFYRCWTRKEAYIKAVGAGLSMPLDVFDVSLAEKPEFLAIRDGKEDAAAWSLHDVAPGPEFAAAVAIRARGLRLQTFLLQGL